MVFGFWDYVGGWLIIAAFLIPIMGAFLVQLISFSVVMVGMLTGVASSDKEDETKRVTMTVRAHDMDEDY
jgi:hypothetical protein